ncbi:uncharacterized protein TNCV_875131 [Trichonephila clavipes]|nr:uncharacterized protein TNCV_875131 [Trichonephila clavipes]
MSNILKKSVGLELPKGPDVTLPDNVMKACSDVYWDNTSWEHFNRLVEILKNQIAVSNNTVDPSTRVEPGEKDYLRDLLREGADRLRGEFNSLQMHPKTQLSKAVQLFHQCRSKEVTVVYGNLGRLPLILTYFLDYCFSAQESVAVIANWEINSPYQVKHSISSVNFMILVEPYFGSVVQKPSYVKHLIVFTSHLSPSLPSCQVKSLHVGAPASVVCSITS